MTSRLPPAPVIRYGDHPDQVANLHLPRGEGPWPCVVLLHGGFWRQGWDRTLMTPVAADLASRGIAAWNVEYRRVGQEGGGWPGTLNDVAAALSALGDVDEVDPARVVAAGHSAGGHLALWLAGRTPAAVSLRGAVSLAGVCDLVQAYHDGLGSGAVGDLLGGSPDEVPDRYREASPSTLLPARVPQLLVHGGRDDVVPPGQSREYADAARNLGETVELVELPGADHFDVVDPDGAAWAAVVAWTSALFSEPPPQPGS